MSKGQATRDRVMDIAEDAILAKGYGGTSIEEIIEAAAITKSGFFYHFPDKASLAKALLERYIVREDILLDDMYGRALELHDDPLHTFLIGLKLLAEAMADLPNGHPGCLIATYCYNERLFDNEIRDLGKVTVLAWRQRFHEELVKISLVYDMADDVDLEKVADMLTAIIEGGIITSKTLREPVILAEQILLYRSYIKLLFKPKIASA